MHRIYRGLFLLVGGLCQHSPLAPLSWTRLRRESAFLSRREGASSDSLSHSKLPRTTSQVLEVSLYGRRLLSVGT